MGKYVDSAGLQHYTEKLKDGTLVVGKAQEAEKVKATNIEGTIPLEKLPAGALERLAVVSDDTARLALTTATVQNGDTVKVESTGKMYFVVDDTKLSTEAGYKEYSVGSAVHADSADHATEAGKVAWSGVTGKPGSFTPSPHNQASNTITAMTGYAKASSAAAITATDSLNTAIGKLEKKMDDITSQGGEPNVLEGVKVNGTALAVGSDKTVNIPAASTSAFGVTKVYNDLAANKAKTDGAVTPAAVSGQLDLKLDKTELQAITDAEIDAIIAG
ncbi:MAG: hypothetical protein K2G12_08530 [Prevotella sp.]|nr:hypothetical protein [Prevotella sp.]